MFTLATDLACDNRHTRTLLLQQIMVATNYEELGNQQDHNVIGCLL